MSDDVERKGWRRKLANALTLGAWEAGIAAERILADIDRLAASISKGTPNDRGTDDE